MSRKANVLVHGSWRVIRGSVLLISCGLALAGWCAPAHDVAVLNSPTTLGQRYTKYFVDVADWLSLSCRVITEADLSDMWTVDDICKEAELLIIPCNDTIARYPAELIRSFAERGGVFLWRTVSRKGWRCRLASGRRERWCSTTRSIQTLPVFCPWKGSCRRRKSMRR